MLYFADEKNPNPSVSDVGDLAEKGLVRGVTVAKKKADKEADKEANKEADKETVKVSAKETAASVIPTSLFAAADLWSAYGVTKGGVYVLTDQFGNEVGRAEEAKVRTFALGAAKLLNARRESVSESAKSAQAALDAKDYAIAFVALKTAFEHKLVGYSESQAAAKVYAAWLESARAAITSAKADEALLVPLRLALTDTPLESELPVVAVAAAAAPDAKDAAGGGEKHGE